MLLFKVPSREEILNSRWDRFFALMPRRYKNEDGSSGVVWLQWAYRKPCFSSSFLREGEVYMKYQTEVKEGK